MAEEEVVVAAAPSDNLKRKLDDLESDVAAGPTGDAELDRKDENAEKASDAVADADADASAAEAKRPRLEDKPNGSASENGNQEEKADELEKVDELKEDVVEQPEAETNIVLPEKDGEEPTKEAQETVNDEEPTKEAQETVNDEKPASDDTPSGDTVKAPEEDGKPQAEKHEAENIQEGPNQEIPQSDPEYQEKLNVSSNEQQAVSAEETISRKMEVPNNKVGVLIGKAGDTIRFLQYNSGAKIQITRDVEADPQSTSRPVELIGTLENINKAEKLIKDVIAEADAGGSPSLVARGFSTVQAMVGEQIEIPVPIDKVGLIIGKGGETIKNLQTRSGARIQLVPQQPPEGDQSKERIVRVTGDRKQIEVAKEMIKEAMNQTARPARPSSLSGGYNQHSAHQRGPTASHWGPRGHSSQYPGYDYHQKGPYPSQNQQYPPQTFGGYSQPAPRSGFGPGGWDQRPPAPMQGVPPQVNYNYGPPQRPDYGQPAPYSQTHPGQYGHEGQNPYGGHTGSQPTYPQGGNHPGYGPPDQYGRPPSYGQQPAHAQAYSQPRPSQAGEVPYQGPVAPTNQTYTHNMPPPQQYPYASSGQMQQPYAPYGSAPGNDGYSHSQPAAVPGQGYPQQGGQSVQGYAQPTGQQYPYAQVGAAVGYGSYPAQPGYTEQPATTNPGYGYQAPADPAAYAAGTATATYGVQAGQQPVYSQQVSTQPGYDQSVPQPGYGSVPAPASYVKSASPQPGAYPQYDSSQMYNAPPH